MSTYDLRDVTTLDPIGRFSARVEDYESFRPDYPAGLIELLRDRCGLSPACIVADLGAGSGRLARLFLENGNAVLALEPNPDMRAAAERSLAPFPGLAISDATAEDTGLESESVDFVVAGSAFHWFDQAAALREALRILQPEGWLAIVRLTRRVSTPLEHAYEELLSRYSPDHSRLRQKRVELEKRLVRCGFEEWQREEEQSTTFEDLLGLSASYSVAPERRQTSFSKFTADLRTLFDSYEDGGRVTLGHDLRLHYCQLHSSEHGLDHDALEPAYWLGSQTEHSAL